MKRKILISALLWSCGINSAMAWDSFKVEAIKYTGLHALQPKIFDSSVTIKPGELITEDKSNQLITALFNTGYFQDVSLHRKGDTLVIDVVEQPTVAKIELKGNELIKTKNLQQVFTSMGLVVGNSISPVLLKNIKLSLMQEYYQQGKFAVRINITQQKLARNRVNLLVDISEGVFAKIKSINIVGNHKYSEHKIIKSLPIAEPSIFSFFTNADRYDPSKLQNAFAALSDFYMDRGYADFKILSQQSSMSPDKKSFYVTFNIEEGQQYKFGTYEIKGDTIVPMHDLHELIDIKKGGVFSRAKVISSVKAIQNKIADKGYAFVNIQPIPEIDHKTGVINFKFYVDPGRKVIVRNINFKGNTNTNEIVFRRDMQFVEDSVYSGTKIDKSVMKLQQHPYVASATHTVVPVIGSSDKVDIDYMIKERNANGVKFSIGYSDLDKVFIGSSLNMPNIFGTGNAFSISTQLSRPSQSLSVSFEQPYFTLSGISQSFSAYLQREDNARRQNYIGYSMDSYGFDLGYGFPLSSEDRLDLGIGYSFNHLFPPGGTDKSVTVDNFISDNNGKSKFNSYLMNIGWSHNSLNHAFFPTKGYNSSLTAKASVPGSNLTWYTVGADGSWFHAVNDYLTFNLKGQVQYGDGYGKTKQYPFFRNYYAGGWGSIRGFADSDLGPHDTMCSTIVNGACTSAKTAGNAIGGNLLVAANASMYFPVPFAMKNDSMRMSVFLDAGNVYDTYHVKSAYEGNWPAHPNFSNLRYSAGVAFMWLSPVGNIGFSLAEPIKKHSGDQTQMFQFTMGQNF